MTVYLPDNWVVLKFNTDDPHYRLLTGVSGGYTQGDEWRMNSGITACVKEGKYYIFFGSSGSEYRCHEEMYRLRMNNAHIFAKLQSLHGEDVVVMMPEETDWENMDWLIDQE